MVLTARLGKLAERSYARTTKLLLPPLLAIAALLIEAVSRTTSSPRPVTLVSPRFADAKPDAAPCAGWRTLNGLRPHDCAAGRDQLGVLQAVAAGVDFYPDLIGQDDVVG